MTVAGLSERTSALLFVWFYTTTFYIVCSYGLYLLITLNRIGIIVMIFMIALQKLFGMSKSQRYITFVQRYFHPERFFKKF